MSPSRPRRPVLAAVAAVALAALGTAPVASAAPVAPATAPAFAQPARAQTSLRPQPRRGATVAKIVAPVVARAAPDARARAVWRVATATGWSRQSQVLLVLQRARDRRGRDWLKLELPIRPNDRMGWIPADYVRLARTSWWIDVSTARRVVTVWRDGRVARRFGAVVGTAGTPTPRGLFAVWERNRQPDPDAFLGPWAIAITGLSDVLESYGGGPGRVALHGRSGASLLDPLGSASSHGCIRIDNGHVSWLARHVPRGTPVQVR